MYDSFIQGRNVLQSEDRTHRQALRGSPETLTTPLVEKQHQKRKDLSTDVPRACRGSQCNVFSVNIRDLVSYVTFFESCVTQNFVSNSMANYTRTSCFESGVEYLS
jgi:hypothetical protein